METKLGVNELYVVSDHNENLIGLTDDFATLPKMIAEHEGVEQSSVSVGNGTFFSSAVTYFFQARFTDVDGDERDVDYYVKSATIYKQK